MWDRFKSTVIIIGAVLSIIAILFGGWRYIDATYAKNVHVIYLNYKLDTKILEDEVYIVQERIWVLEDRLDNLPPDDITIPLTKSQLRQAVVLKKRLDNELKITIDHFKQAEEDTKH